MKQVPMRFKGYTWHHNPRELTFENEKSVKESVAPFDKCVLQNTGRRNMKITGEGELFGADCLEQFRRLLELFREGGSGVLAIADIPSFYAVFESIKLVGKPKPDVLTYRFVFRELMEACGDKQRETIAAQGENLWDLSYRFGIDIDTLVRLNPQVRRPDVLTAGEVVRLC